MVQFGSNQLRKPESNWLSLNSLRKFKPKKFVKLVNIKSRSNQFSINQLSSRVFSPNQLRGNQLKQMCKQTGQVYSEKNHKEPSTEAG
jgi:hypothetical protein